VHSSRLPQPSHCPDDYYQLMLRCWTTQSSQRPKFSEMFLSLLPQVYFTYSLCRYSGCTDEDDDDDDDDTGANDDDDGGGCS